MNKSSDDHHMTDPESHLAAIVESSEDAIVSKDVDGRILSWNSGAERIYGYSASEAIGQPIAILFAPDRADEEDEILSEIRRGERIDHFETVRQRKDGRRIHVSLTVSPIRDRSGTIIGASHIARDVTDRKHADEQLRMAKEQLQLLTDNLPAAVTRCSRDLRYVWVSRRYAEWQHKRVEQIVGKPILEIVGQAGFEDIRPYIERVLSGEKVEYTAEVHFLGAGNRW